MHCVINYILCSCQYWKIIEGLDCARSKYGAQIQYNRVAEEIWLSSGDMLQSLLRTEQTGNQTNV